jgi:hypothetical protein
VFADGPVLVERNHVEDAYGEGLVVGTGAGSRVWGNTALRNGVGAEGDGIAVRSPGIEVGHNIANDNFDLGIEAVAGTIDRGGNRARGNGNPVQCVGVHCK